MAKSTSFLKIGFRLTSLILFFISFSLNSLLVFYFGFLVFLFAVTERDKTPRKDVITKFLILHIDYIVLPFVYWIIKDAVFSPHGSFSV